MLSISLVLGLARRRFTSESSPSRKRKSFSLNIVLISVDLPTCLAPVTI
ncbi:MAG: hypothetical protein QM763_03015 [Agriterribacter sp.]